MESTRPKPFVFVLMPFDSGFNDIYRFGIKGAADDAEAYAERVDEQTFVEGILDRILNQINKADVIVADMTGKNANVFYEVGYAHALDKIVLLTTQNTDDIPFDLKHRPHTVYGGSIEKLREDLGPKIRWAISESEKRRSQGGGERMSISLAGIEVPQGIATQQSPEIAGMVTASTFRLPLYLRNDGNAPMESISHVYLFASENAEAVPAKMVESTYNPEPFVTGKTTSMLFLGSVPIKTPLELTGFEARQVDAPDGLTKQFRLPVIFGSIPAGAIEKVEITFLMRGLVCRSLYRFRLHTSDRFYDFGFRVNIQQEPAQIQQASPESSKSNEDD